MCVCMCVCMCVHVCMCEGEKFREGAFQTYTIMHH